MVGLAPHGGVVVRTFGRLGAVTAAGDDQRANDCRVPDGGVECGEPAHRQADDMRAVDAEAAQHVSDVVRRPFLAVRRGGGRYIGRWITAGIEGDTPTAGAEVLELRRPAPKIAGKFMNEDNRLAGAGCPHREGHSV